MILESLHMSWPSLCQRDSQPRDWSLNRISISGISFLVVFRPSPPTCSCEVEGHTLEKHPSHFPSHHAYDKIKGCYTLSLILYSELWSPNGKKLFAAIQKAHSSNPPAAPQANNAQSRPVRLTAYENPLEDQLWVGSNLSVHNNNAFIKIRVIRWWVIII